jgi:predicted nucleotidyltransferase
MIATLQAALPNLLAIYLFGSHAQDNAGPDSDIDIAVLVAGKLDPLQLWELAQEIGPNLDILDLRTASTVMQYQIITTGLRLWTKNAQAAIFESTILSDKTELDTARAPLLADIQREGTIYGNPASNG